MTNLSADQATTIIAAAAKNLVAVEGTSFEAVARKNLEYLIELFMPILAG